MQLLLALLALLLAQTNLAAGLSLRGHLLSVLSTSSNETEITAAPSSAPSSAAPTSDEATTTQAPSPQVDVSINTTENGTSIVVINPAASNETLPETLSETLTPTESPSSTTTDACLVQSASLPCPNNTGLVSFGHAEATCCPVKSSNNLASPASFVVSVVLGSGQSRGVASTGYLIQAEPTVSLTQRVSLAYQEVPFVRTRACNQIDVLISAGVDGEVPLVRCVKRDELVTAVWLFTQIDQPSLRLAVRCCQIDDQE